MVILTVVDIAAYLPLSATANCTRHEPFVAGRTSRPATMRHEPERTVQVLAPFEGVVMILVNCGDCRTLWVVVRTVKPGITRATSESAELTPEELSARTCRAYDAPFRRLPMRHVVVVVTHRTVPSVVDTT